MPGDPVRTRSGWSRRRASARPGLSLPRTALPPVRSTCLPCGNRTGFSWSGECPPLVIAFTCLAMWPSPGRRVAIVSDLRRQALSAQAIAPPDRGEATWPLVWQSSTSRVAGVWRVRERATQLRHESRSPLCTPLHGTERGLCREDVHHSPCFTPAGTNRGARI